MYRTFGRNANHHAPISRAIIFHSVFRGVSEIRASDSNNPEIVTSCQEESKALRYFHRSLKKKRALQTLHRELFSMHKWHKARVTHSRFAFASRIESVELIMIIF